MVNFYASEILYSENVAVMEMICTSVCLTSMTCFTMEATYRKENLFDEKVQMNDHSMDARGNATSFMLPWQ